MTTESVRSADGTVIAVERTGSGPPLILVEAAGHFRAFSSFTGLVPLLAADFTVLDYDRRGRGDSTDTPPYAIEREIEDLGALIDAVDGRACIYAFSSGGLLALHAAAAGLAIERMVLLEPPVELRHEPDVASDFTIALRGLVDAGRDDAAVEYFLTGIGVPDEIVESMRDDESWTAMESVAQTLVYDSMISDATTVAVLTEVAAPTLVLESQGSSEDLTGMASEIATRLPAGVHRSLPGEWHGVPDGVLAPAIVAFLTGPG